METNTDTILDNVICGGSTSIPKTSYLCIPKIHNSVKRDYIFKKLCMLRVGFIQKLVEIPLKSNNNFKRVMVRVVWNQDSKSVLIRDRLCNGKPVYFVYDDPWFWKIAPFETQH